MEVDIGTYQFNIQNKNGILGYNKNVLGEDAFKLAADKTD